MPWSRSFSFPPEVKERRISFFADPSLMSLLWNFDQKYRHGDRWREADQVWRDLQEADARGEKRVPDYLMLKLRYGVGASSWVWRMTGGETAMADRATNTYGNIYAGLNYPGTQIGGTDAAWTSWNQRVMVPIYDTQVTAKYSVDMQITWTDWNQTYALALQGPATVLNRVAPGLQTAAGAEMARYEQSQIELRARHAEERAQRNLERVMAERAAAEVATRKAEALLMKILSPKQREQYRMHGWFETEINDKVYRIKKGRSGNVALLDKAGKEVESLCCHPAVSCPDPDTMLAQLVHLQTNEAQFRRTANITRLWMG